MKFLKQDEVAVYALGGLGEVGKNTYCIEYKDEIIVIDAGIKFPGDDLAGVEYVLADYTHLMDNKEKIQALIITHGHEDHIGGISFMIKQIPSLPKIYAPKLACGLIRKKVSARDLNSRKDFLVQYDETTVIKTKNMTIEFFRTNHSIPDSFGLAVRTPEGIVIHTGDFKFDLTPVGEPANYGKMAALGNEGVLCLLSDSTSAEVKGFTESERVVDQSVREIFRKTQGRIIVATFASNVHRLKHIVDTAIKNKRKIAVAGRSMENIVKIANENGHIPDISKHLININNLKNYPENEITILCTGSQGEPLAALSRMANGVHRQVKIMPGDTVVFSSSPIPGNDIKIGNTIDMLYRRGAKVYTNRENNIHTSGHGSQKELLLMLHLIRPKYFMPIHGEYRMLHSHAQLAKQIGIDKEHTFILGNGDVLALSKDNAHVAGKVSGNDIFIHGRNIGDLSESVIKDRKTISDDGIVAIAVNINIKDQTLVGFPLIQSRGFIKVNESTELIKKINQAVKLSVVHELKNGVNKDAIKKAILSSAQVVCKDATGRNPIIIPVLMEII